VLEICVDAKFNLIRFLPYTDGSCLMPRHCWSPKDVTVTSFKGEMETKEEKCDKILTITNLALFSTMTKRLFLS
jgi:hypothetical protein